MKNHYLKNHKTLNNSDIKKRLRNKLDNPFLHVKKKFSKIGSVDAEKNLPPV